ncbi:MAG: hypothetical protein GY853_12495 [PVC group bacterium]|nr:hypothetical protein [PVC group bacterium]
MKFKDFIDNVRGEGWDWAEGIYEGKKGYFVRANNRKINTKEKGLQPACIHITPDAIENNEWESIKKQFPDLTYVTRIVGYYSQIHNWNSSKQEELGDRHKGCYKVNQEELNG